MKKITLAAFTFLSFTSAFAFTVKDIPKSPPPYGAYYLTHNGDTNAEQIARKLAVVKHYGFESVIAAKSDCYTVNGQMGGKYKCTDALAHKRDSHPVAQIELKKYGFKDWVEAVKACRAKPRNDLDHCTVDPFLQLRGK